MEEYSKLIKNIFSRHASVANVGFTSDAYKPGLERMTAFDEACGCPSKAFRSIHVAGTNGKGSVSHMLSASLAASGMRVGLFTSPHIADFRERARIISPAGMEMIPEEAVVEFLTSREALIEELGMSFFEITTGLAFWWFAQSGVDAAVIEVGLGGRLDSTNIITPQLSIITSIGLDHCDLLGSTRAAIAGEKAGIFKEGVPALIGLRDDETAPVFEARAKELSCPLRYASDEELPDAGWTGHMDLKGDYQPQNVRTVLCALQILGAAPSKEAIWEAAARTGLRGRWEALCSKPLVICDIGHNPPALEWNFGQLKGMMASGKYSSLHIVYGVMADKDLASILPLMPQEAVYSFVTPATSRALPSQKILEAAGFEGARAFDDVASGLIFALGCADEDSLIYVGGSTYVVADAIKYFESL